MVFDNVVLGWILLPQRQKGDEDEWTPELEASQFVLFTKYSTSRMIKNSRWHTHVKFDQKTWRDKPFGRPRHRWEYSIKMDLQETRQQNRDWMPLAQDRDHWQATAKMANKPSGSTKWGEFINYLWYFLSQEGIGSMDCKATITNMAMLPNLVLWLFTHELHMLICQLNKTFIT